MLKRLLAVALVAAGVALVVGSWHAKGASAQSAPETEQTEVPPTLEQVQQAALTAAAADGEPAPTAVEVTTGTLAQAAHMIDPQTEPPAITDPRTGKPWSESAVYVATMQGQFTYGGPLPRNAAMPTGSTLTIAVDAKSGFVVADALSSSPRDLREINPTVTTLGG